MLSSLEINISFIPITAPGLFYLYEDLLVYPNRVGPQFPLNMTSNDVELTPGDFPHLGKIEI